MLVRILQMCCNTLNWAKLTWLDHSGGGDVAHSFRISATSEVSAKVPAGRDAASVKLFLLFAAESGGVVNGVPSAAAKCRWFRRSNSASSALDFLESVLRAQLAFEALKGLGDVIRSIGVFAEGQSSLEFLQEMFPFFVGVLSQLSEERLGLSQSSS
eukprot:scaffold17233_cov87-Cylindrotheca_fusiformis.AAC.4